MACMDCGVTKNPSLLIFSLFILFMCFTTWDKQQRLEQYYEAQKAFRLSSFEAYKKTLKHEDQEKLKLWESFLTGRSAPVSKWIKEDYKQLGLNHVFSPSGFHLSALIFPLTFIVPHRKFHFFLLLIMAIVFFFIPGQWAIKRVLHLKIGQHFLGLKGGLILAISLDIITGALSHSPLSFAFSYLFLSLIISKGFFLKLHFFFAQMLIFYFSSDLVSPLLIFLSPILNLILTLVFPLLCLMAIPATNWSFELGLNVMKVLQLCVEFAVKLTTSFPLWEVNFSLILGAYFIYQSNKSMIIICLLLMSHNLNVPTKGQIKLGTFDFAPPGTPVRSLQKQDYMMIYYKEGHCRRELRYGLWWEKCSPKKRSTHKN